jgi:hypothetical protein
MRRLIPVLLVVAVFAVPASASAALVSLRGGHGTAVLAGSGTALGLKVARGSVRITDLPRGAHTVIHVTGAEHVVRVSRRTKVYRGRDMTFTVSYGRWRVGIRGAGIDVSASLRGRLTLRGIAGTYQIGSGPVRDWPRVRTSFFLR